MSWRLLLVFLLIGTFFSAHSGQSLRMRGQLSTNGPYQIGVPYTLWIEADSTRLGSFAEPEIEASPLFELTLKEQEVYTFMEQETVYYGIRFRYLLVPKESGEHRLVPQLYWTNKETQEKILCPPQHFSLVFVPFFNKLGWIVGGGVGFFLLGLFFFWFRQRKKQKFQNTFEGKTLEDIHLDALSELARFRMEGDFKSYFAGLEALYQRYAQEKKEDSPEYRQKLSELQKFSENVRFASLEVNPNDLESYTEYFRHLLERNRKRK